MEKLSVLHVTTAFPFPPLNPIKAAGMRHSDLRFKEEMSSYCVTSAARVDFPATTSPGVDPWMLI